MGTMNIYIYLLSLGQILLIIVKRFILLSKYTDIEKIGFQQFLWA